MDCSLSREKPLPRWCDVSVGADARVRPPTSCARASCRLSSRVTRVSENSAIVFHDADTDFVCRTLDAENEHLSASDGALRCGLGVQNSNGDFAAPRPTTALFPVFVPR